MATQAKPQSFQDREFFPSFSDCPLEYSWDDRYLVERGDATVVNRKHWCLLGDIIHVSTFARLRVVAKDHKGDTFVVGFYVDDLNDMLRMQKEFKIIPLGLKDAIKMNEQVLKYTVAEGTQRKCHGCDNVKMNINACAGCTLFYYCNKDCQAKAWKEKEHKKFCKILSREDIKLTHFLKYETYDASVSFE
ncbi:putative set domain protein [Daldinia childiae]|uniref:putative set domain protein n=1 Tax=Daldinia childiae TaxID=326645 RepID=UPI001448563A|nr:putative set domain protein [Daldinia childiae]KAF3067121.1 putative set domain protein [Daldinia childiae]